MILTIYGRRAWPRREAVETWLLVAGAMAALDVVFGGGLGRTATHHPLEYVIFPFVIAAAVRADNRPLPSSPSGHPR